MTLKQIWCGLTTGHYFIAHDVSTDKMRQTALVCQDCGKQAKSRIVKLDLLPGDVTGMYDGKPAIFKVTKDPSVVRNVLGPILVETLRFDDKALPPGKRIMWGGKLIGIVTPKTTEHPNKAHAATRKRGPNGQFLPVLLPPKKKLSEAQIVRVHRKLVGKYAKGKKK